MDIIQFFNLYSFKWNKYFRLQGFSSSSNTWDKSLCPQKVKCSYSALSLLSWFCGQKGSIFKLIHSSATSSYIAFLCFREPADSFKCYWEAWWGLLPSAYNFWVIYWLCPSCISVLQKKQWRQISATSSHPVTLLSSLPVPGYCSSAHMKTFALDGCNQQRGYQVWYPFHRKPKGFAKLFVCLSLFASNLSAENGNIGGSTARQSRLLSGFPSSYHIRSASCHHMWVPSILLPSHTRKGNGLYWCWISKPSFSFTGDRQSPAAWGASTK